MKTKRGNELDVLGQSIVGGRPFFVCKLPEPIYWKDELVSVVVLPASEFDFDDGTPRAEIVQPDEAAA